jgi:hypothetical protein
MTIGPICCWLGTSRPPKASGASLLRQRWSSPEVLHGVRGSTVPSQGQCWGGTVGMQDCLEGRGSCCSILRLTECKTNPTRAREGCTSAQDSTAQRPEDVAVQGEVSGNHRRDGIQQTLFGRTMYVCDASLQERCRCCRG